MRKIFSKLRRALLFLIALPLLPVVILWRFRRKEPEQGATSPVVPPTANVVKLGDPHRPCAVVEAHNDLQVSDPSVVSLAELKLPDPHSGPYMDPDWRPHWYGKALTDLTTQHLTNIEKGIRKGKWKTRDSQVRHKPGDVMHEAILTELHYRREVEADDKPKKRKKSKRKAKK